MSTSVLKAEPGKLDIKTIQQAFSRPSLINLISKDANLVFYLSVYPLIHPVSPKSHPGAWQATEWKFCSICFIFFICENINKVWYKKSLKLTCYQLDHRVKILHALCSTHHSRQFDMPNDHVQKDKWAATWDFQQCGMCDQQSLRSACAYAQYDESLCMSLEYSMCVKLLTEPYLEFLNLKGDCTGSSESTLVKMPHCWKSHVTAQLWAAAHPTTPSPTPEVFPSRQNKNPVRFFIIFLFTKIFEIDIVIEI